MAATMIIANVLDPRTGQVSAMNATRWSGVKREMFEAGAEATGLKITYTYK